jgi:hypothetical protein
MKSTHVIKRVADHLYMTVSGEYDLQDFKSYVKIIRDTCEEEQIFKTIMNTLDIKGIDVPTIERYFMGVEVAEQLSFRIKLAIVWHKEYTNYIGEIVALNRGGNVGVFANDEAAMKWLIHGIRE